ncbi:MAG: efflux RND transporter periplasmic adaptor subunit [Chloroflexi bacterium]|nr:efflux RND transporter periplasmic adaptor subunit [Chloroflexota bacterium]
MKMKRPSLPVIVIVVLVVIVALYYGISALNNSSNAQLKASGTIEAVTVNVSPELAGKVKDVLVDEGQMVKAGDPLLHLDDSLLTAQRAVAAAQADTAKAALASAQTNYNQTLQNALTAEGSNTAKVWHFSAPDQFNQPLWYFSQPEEIASAQAEVDAAQKALTDAQTNLHTVISDLNNADFLNAEKRLSDARAAFLVADSVKTVTDNAVEGGGVQKAGDANYNAALDELRAAQDAYNTMLNSKAATNVENARGQVVVAQQRYDTAYSRLLSLQTGTQSPAVLAASKALDQTKASAQQADANLALLDAQMAKLAVYAPMDGTILTRNVEPGEFVQPGAVALTMANISELTITVYVPEDRLNEIGLNQNATVILDSATRKNPTFSAVVVHISDQAEFTPRNVQTVEGRSSTVYAVKLKISDPSSELKIGMPADVVFK